VHIALNSFLLKYQSIKGNETTEKDILLGTQAVLQMREYIKNAIKSVLIIPLIQQNS
jgi:hypothetical protein